MKIDHIKLFAITIFAIPLLLLAVFNANPSVGASTGLDDDAATVYKTKCAMCHSPKAEKFFDPAKTDDELAEIILKGKKGEKPPFMPGFETKGMTADQAKALVVHMRKLRTPAN